jgi:hypothetical protein
LPEQITGVLVGDTGKLNAIYFITTAQKIQLKKLKIDIYNKN